MGQTKQAPMLMVGPFTERVCVVTKYKPLKTPGQFEALEKFDIHDEFMALATRLLKEGKLGK